MERLQERLNVAEKAFNTLEEVMAIVQPNSIERDASIQRFEFTFEAVWKAAKQWLYDVEGLDVGSPKSVIRTFREIGLFDEETTVLGLQMVNDRNLTVHTYNEALANEIYSKLTLYAPLLKDWIRNMKEKI
ncbi:HI0074 family nucleotidyltransferase substrate-binding subunit [Ammoniphilus sp. YIM 78166]|uniref:HI0074 family nucleotidyltransferase substrate-binding subunit n=1 Tax=Ammoniphilus sp. YIM 78166 TaxID=1644106 RepID=UPI0010704673|nr:HI0074 family nucleotidyltransferase substrate-binding subunit [Ammoniphilus sp. YIM 78166]